MKIRTKNKVVLPALLFISLYSCKGKDPERNKHEIEVSRPGTFFYLDRVKNKQVMEIKDAEQDSLYRSYVVGFIDSTYAPDPQQPNKTEALRTYYRFRMGDRWRGIVNGDSLVPVFYQPVSQTDTRLNAGVIVFQLEKGMQPDTLVYRSADDGWETMIISLKQHKLIQ